MKGIMLKDLYENFYIKKYLATYIFGLVFTSAAFFFASSKYTYILFVILLNMVFGSCMLEAPYEQDEKANFNRLQITFPVTKAEIVLAKYMLALIFTGMSTLYSLVFSLLSLRIHHIVSLSEAMTIWGTGIGVSLIFTSVVYVFYFLLGKKVGVAVYIIFAMILGMLYGGFSVVFGVENYTAVDQRFLLIFLPASAAIFTISCLLSIWIYKKKYS